MSLRSELLLLGFALTTLWRSVAGLRKVLSQTADDLQINILFINMIMLLSTQLDRQWLMRWARNVLHAANVR